MDMCNCLKMQLSRLRKFSVSLIVFAALSFCVQAETYTWIGENPDENNWTNPQNWKTETENPATSYPNTDSDTARFIFTTQPVYNEIVINTPVTVKNIDVVTNYADAKSYPLILNLSDPTLSDTKLTINNSLNIGTGNDSNPGHLKITDGKISLKVFDQCDNAENSLYLDNVELQIISEGTVYGNGTSGKIEINGSHVNH